MSNATASPNPFASRLPHRPPMLMLSTLLEQRDDHIRCDSTIQADNPLLHDGLLPACAGLELLAQAAGALLGARSADQACRPGAIVQIKSFRLRPTHIPVGSTVHIHAHFQAGNAAAALFDGEVSLNGQEFFSASLMIALLPGGRR